MPNITATESVVVVEDTDSYTEAYLMTDGTIQMHVEDGESALDTIYTLEQAEAIHRTLGHLLYLARQEA
jgi:hypothetical protein